MVNRFAGLKKDKAAKNMKAERPETDQQQLQQSALLPRRRGRPNGKRTNKDYRQVTAYVRSDTYKRVSITLLEQDKKGEFSDLVENLLQAWLTKQ
jgi:hypothetical protein